jgi:hypothetical protein
MASGETDGQIDYWSADQRKRYQLLLLLMKCFSRWVAVMITPTGCGGLVMGPINLSYSCLIVNLWKEPNNFLFVISCTSSNNYDDMDMAGRNLFSPTDGTQWYNIKACR